MHGDGRQDETEATAARPGGRRLADRLLAAIHAACDQGELDAARALLTVLEDLLGRLPAKPDPQRRRHQEGLVAAHERLWDLRRRDAGRA